MGKRKMRPKASFGELGFLLARLVVAPVLFQTVLVGTALSGQPEGASACVRCAVIGGMMDTGFWPALAKGFEEKTGIRVEVVAKGPKQVLIPAFVGGKADLIVMHASDAMINLVADGYGVDPQPWARNDLVLVGPPSDPAGIRGMTDAGKALRKIFHSGSRFLIQRSLGAQQVFFDLVQSAHVPVDWGHVLVRLHDPDRQMLKWAAEKDAYVLVGRIPFRNGKIPNGGLEVLVQGDPRLRRPYLVVTANPVRVGAARAERARRLADFLRTPETQAWIAEFGRGVLDDRPLFFPVRAEPSAR